MAANRNRIGDDRSLKGLASLYKRGNRLLIRLPDNVGLGRDKYWSTGLPAIASGVAEAQRILMLINNDIVYGKFDKSLQSYNYAYRSEYVKQAERHRRTVQQLWSYYCESRQQKLKQSSYYYLVETIGSKIRLMPEFGLEEAEQVTEWLRSNTTEDYTLRVLNKLKSLYDWCVDRELITEDVNPYKKVIRLFREDKVPSPEPAPRPLTTEELLNINKLSPTYLPLAKFQLLTGCRPGEAVGVEWQDVKEDHLVLGRNYVKKGGQVFESETSKTNKTRLFPKHTALAEFLGQLEVGTGKIFTSSVGKPIIYRNYVRAWDRVMPKDTTPYCCRDTFISQQVERGVPPAVIAQWVGNSVTVIERHYLKVSLEVQPKF